jgi:hypothetical protein
MRVFLDQPGDFPPGEEFFKMRQQFVVEASRDDEATAGGKAFFVKDLNRGGRHWQEIVGVKRPEALVHRDLGEFSPDWHGYFPGNQNMVPTRGRRKDHQPRIARIYTVEDH